MFEPHDIELGAIRCTDPSLENYSEAEVADMARALAEDGQREPIVVDPTLTIIWNGHTRYLAARRLGWRTIKAIVLTPDQWSEALRNRQITS